MTNPEIVGYAAIALIVIIMVLGHLIISYLSRIFRRKPRFKPLRKAARQPSQRVKYVYLNPQQQPAQQAKRKGGWL